MTVRQQRRLAAILAADIAGYSALMGADEARTVRDLKGHQAVVLPLVTQFGGRIIDTAGDGILAEFGSVVNAVECAVALQKTMTGRNATVEVERQMHFRIGINLGDVIHDETRVYGDGVNIAARLEGIAEPGGICVSGAAYDQVHKKLLLNFTDLGEQQLKNISQSVRVYRVEPAELRSAPVLAKQPLALPDKPSIAVLPFANMSGDKEQEYFSDGITEDIITELSRFSELFVIARNSSFQYKGKSPDIRQVGRELGVRYILEGSIRRAGDRVRITAQLIDASTGAHRWAERYDRELSDVFAVQDEVARTIATILAVHIQKAEIQHVLVKPPATWQAYDYFMRAANAWAMFWSSYDVQKLYETRAALEQSLAIDPNFARAYAVMANTYNAAWNLPLDCDYLNPEARERGLTLARRAVQLDPLLPYAHAILAVALTWKGENDAALAAIERSITLNPNYTDWRFAIVFVNGGDARRALRLLLDHLRLDPFYPPIALNWLGGAHYMLKQYSGAITALQESVSRSANSRAARVWLAAAYAQSGQLAQAQAEAAQVLRIEPTYTIDGVQRKLSLYKNEADASHLFDGLRKAGLPDR